MLKETDWKDVGRDAAGDAKAFAKRVKYEAGLLAKMSPEEFKDFMINGEKQLGKLYRNGKMATVRREWRGIKDTGADFYEWAKMWGMLLATFGKDLIPSLNGALHYRWMISYFCCHSFMDKNTLGLRGKALKMHHELIYAIFRYVAENLVLLMKADVKGGNSTDLSRKIVLLDEMTMAQIMAGFPDLAGIPYQLMPVFLLSEIDQLACMPYIDAVESYGLPSDTCPVPTSECGACVIDALPHLGSCFISSSMPCDGSVMASSYTSRRFKDLPTFHLAFPVRYEDESIMDAAVQDIKACIRFIEEFSQHEQLYHACRHKRHIAMDGKARAARRVAQIDECHAHVDVRIGDQFFHLGFHRFVRGVFIERRRLCGRGGLKRFPGLRGAHGRFADGGR
jgi:hypothetical protein